jgi:hypothetical protein
MREPTPTPGKHKPRSDRSVPASGTHSQVETKESLDERLDEALEESFPASDPPAVHHQI